MKIEKGESGPETVIKLKKKLAGELIKRPNMNRLMNRFAMEEGLRTTTVKNWIEEIQQSGVLDEIKRESNVEDYEVQCDNCPSKYYYYAFNGECPTCKNKKIKEMKDNFLLKVDDEMDILIKEKQEIIKKMEEYNEKIPEAQEAGDTSKEAEYKRMNNNVIDKLEENERKMKDLMNKSEKAKG